MSYTRREMTRLTLVLVALAALNAAEYPFQDLNLPVEKRIENLLSLMTADEKVACLGTQTRVPRLGVANIGSSEGIHGVVQRGGGQANRAPIPTTQFPQPP